MPETFERLRDEGVIRYIGVTGHSSRVLADALEDYPYDCALITLNAAGDVMDDPEDLDPLIERGLDIHRLLPHVLSYPVSTAVVGIAETAHLEANVCVAKNFEPLGEEEMAELRALARSRSDRREIAILLT